MSNPLRRASRANKIPKMKPLRPQFVMPQFGGQGSQGTIEGDPTRLDLRRRRVVPIAPTGLVGTLSQDFFADGTYVDIEEEVPEAMYLGSYFSNLMSTEFSYPTVYAAAAAAAGLPDDTPPPDETVAQELAPAVAKDKRRSKNFSVDEDILLVSAWLNVTLDAIQGVDQSRNPYWKRIHDYFHANKKFESDRSQGSLMNHWSGIQHDVNVFAGCLSKIEAKDHSGWSVDDKIASACVMFKEDDKFHRNFSYMHCWKILKDKPKWMERREHISNPKPGGKKQKTTAN